MDALLNNAPCGFVAFSDDGTMVELNQTLADLLGYTRIELLGWHVEKILPPGARIFYQTYLFPMLKVHGRVEEMFLALRTKDGSDVPVLLNAVRRERDDRMLCDCICMRTIQRHEYEAQLLEARRLAEESASAKAKFLSMMSHDLRTPLTTIYGNTELLAAEVYGPLTDEQRTALQTIGDACAMQIALINDVLDFARLESGSVQVEPRPMRVADAVARAETLLRLQMSEAGLRFTTSGCDGELTAVADPDRLQQILLNLLTNAIKFTPRGGGIAVSCERRGDRVRIDVRDTGIGIPPDDLPRIFSPFVQLGAAGAPSRGVGLGLAISRDLARAMSGEVSAISTPGEGSTFTIELPAA
ncbi:MAG TPA: HAMP domain-containing sensor histidine kinase [Thermoanaerobaculia bacterium]|jgi:PAS domain S-box-containing protein